MSELGLARAAIRAADLDASCEPARSFALDYLERHPDALLRSCPAAHLTGSAMVVDPASQAVLLLLHRKLERWLQPGGHADGEGDLAAVALREATEETGIAGLVVRHPAIDLDVHEVRPPGEPPHLHIDLRFLVTAPPAAVPEGNHESLALRWVSMHEMPRLGVDHGLLRLARRALASLGAPRSP